MHRVACIDCGQVGALKKSAETPRQPSDFNANCTVSMASTVDKCWASGCLHTCPRFRSGACCRAGLFASRTSLLPHEKTRRPTRLSGHFVPGADGTCNRPLESDRSRPMTRRAGAAGRNRTCDPLLRREMLYPLSYSRQRASVSRVPGRAGCGIERSADCRSSRNCTRFGHAGARSTGAAVLYSQPYDVANGDDAATPFYLESGRRQTWVRNSRWQACWPSARSPVH
jgi:hypothetical protein